MEVEQKEKPKAEPIRRKGEKKLQKLEGIEIKLTEPEQDKLPRAEALEQEIVEEVEPKEMFKHIEIHDEEEEIFPLVQERWLRKRGGKTKFEKFKTTQDKKITKKKGYKDFIKASEQEINKNIRETLQSSYEISDVKSVPRYDIDVKKKSSKKHSKH